MCQRVGKPLLEGLRGHSSVVAPGKAESTEHLSPTTSGVLLAPSRALTSRHLLLRHWGHGMCPLKDRTVPSFFHPAAICAPSVLAGMGWHTPQPCQRLCSVPKELQTLHLVLSRSGNDPISPSRGRKTLPKCPNALRCSGGDILAHLAVPGTTCSLMGSP